MPEAETDQDLSMLFRTLSIISTTAAVMMAGSALSAEIAVSPSARSGLTITVYNGDLALVRDTRRIEVPKGETDIAFGGVSAQMQPSTALLRSDMRGVTVREQVFDFDVIGQSSLLRAYVGREVTVVRINPASGEEIESRATVVSVDNGIVLEIDGRLTTEIPGRLVFDSRPESVRTQPTLVANLVAERDASGDASLSYLTSGLNWSADYVAELSTDGKTIDLSAWATVSNTTGVDYPEATLKLVAGDINRVGGGRKVMAMEMMQSDVRMAAMAPGVQEESLSAFHLYAIGRAVDLGDRQTKQLALLSAPGLGVEEDLFSRGDGMGVRTQITGRDRTENVTRALVFTNTEEEGAGVPLPAGTVRVYGQDSSGTPQLLGEDVLAHTPVGEEARLVLGRDFDVTVERRQDEFVRASDRITISAHTIEVRNAKATPVTVRLVEALQGDWEILEENSGHSRVDGAPEWRVTVPAGGAAELTYRVRVRF